MFQLVPARYRVQTILAAFNINNMELIANTSNRGLVRLAFYYPLDTRHRSVLFIKHLRISVKLPLLQICCPTSIGHTRPTQLICPKLIMAVLRITHIQLCRDTELITSTRIRLLVQWARLYPNTRHRWVSFLRHRVSARRLATKFTRPTQLICPKLMMPALQVTHIQLGRDFLLSKMARSKTLLISSSIDLRDPEKMKRYICIIRYSRKH